MPKQQRSQTKTSQLEVLNKYLKAQKRNDPTPEPKKTRGRNAGAKKVSDKIPALGDIEGSVVNQEFGKWLAKQREELELSVLDLCKAINITKAAVYNIERGVSGPHLTTVAALCAFMNVSFDAFVRDLRGKYKPKTNTEAKRRELAPTPGKRKVTMAELAEVLQANGIELGE